jgi:sulfate transport system permease protein
MPIILFRFRDLPIPRTRKAISESIFMRRVCISAAVLFLGLFLLIPLVSIFVEAFRYGLGVYLASFTDKYALAAIRLTLTVTVICVPLNTIFGVAAAWVISKHDFRAKSLLTTLIDLPFAVSPVIAGLLFILIFGAHGYFGPWLDQRNIRIVFALPGIVLATLFITFPFVARELIPIMQAQGREDEYAALTLGASGWRTFWHVTLPNVKWGLFYGVILCNARAMGEFGAVAVVSGNIRGLTSTMPLYIETLYLEYAMVSAFALSSVLALLALVTLILKNLIEWRQAALRGA